LLPVSIRIKTMNRAMRCADRRFASRGLRRLGMVGIVLSALLFSGCHKATQPVTITVLDAEGQGFPGDHRMIPDVYLQEFTRETGIRVNDVRAAVTGSL
jgi:hypothetical protein